jgi:hypothetical protein
MKNKIKELDLIQYYQDYYNLSLEDFRKKSIDLVTDARKPNPVLINQVKSMQSKNSILMAVNNFIQKGHGFGVI